MKILSLCNIKGGVGKTTFAVNIAYHASQAGINTLLWDLDPQGSATYLLRVKPKLKADASDFVAGKSSIAKSINETHWPLLDVLPAEFGLRRLPSLLEERKHHSARLSKSARAFASGYDLVVVDSAPEASAVSENILNLSDLILVPVIPNQLSIKTFEKLLDFAERAAARKPRIVAAFNMVDRRRQLHKQLLNAHIGYDARFLRSYVPASSAIELMARNRAPLSAFNARSVGSTSFVELTSEALSVLGTIR